MGATQFCAYEATAMRVAQLLEFGARDPYSWAKYRDLRTHARNKRTKLLGPMRLAFVERLFGIGWNLRSEWRTRDGAFQRYDVRRHVN